MMIYQLVGSIQKTITLNNRFGSTSGSIYYSNTLFTFVESFIETPVITTNTVDNTSFYGVPTPDSFRGYYMQATNGGSSVDNWQAIGKYK